MATQRDIARIVNRTDAEIVLPAFYLSEADAEAKKNVQKKRLGAACDRGLVGIDQPELGLNEYATRFLHAHKIVRGMMARVPPWIEFQAPSLTLGG